MAWLSRNNFTPSDYVHADDLNNLANDQRTWGGNVNGGGHTLANVVLTGPSGFQYYLSPVEVVPGPSGPGAIIQYDSTVNSRQVARWTAGKDANAETGGNVGSNFGIARYDDSGALLETTLSIIRQTGEVIITGAAGTGPPFSGGGTLWMRDSAAGINNGGVIVFGVAQNWFTGIKGMLVNGAGNTIGDLGFYTRNSTADSALTERVRIAAAGNVGIGNAAPVNLLDVGAGLLGTLAGVHATVSSNTVNSGVNVGQSNANRGRMFWSYNAAPASAYLSVDTVGGNALALQPSSGQVGIGTTTPTSKVTIDNATQAIEIRSGGYLMFRDSANSFDMRIRSGATGRLDLLSGAALSSPLMSVLNTGSVGIGSASPASQLQVAGTAAAGVPTTGPGTLYLLDTGVNIGNGGGIVFGFGAGPLYFAGIRALAQDGTGNTAGDLAFFIRNTTASPSLTEVMRITALGRLGIGVGVATSKLHVAGLTTFASDAAAGAAGLTAGAFFIDSTGVVHAKL